MRLYLVQHGDAVSKEVDPQRPLNDRGRREVKQVAALLGKAGVRPAAVVHSGKQRAEETARLLAAGMSGERRCERISGIDPLDPVADFARVVYGWTQDAMVVGHLPFMAKLGAHLLTGDEERGVLAFHPGTVVCLERTEQDTWSLNWMIRPELASSHGT